MEAGAVRICGGVKSGKTEALLEKACFLANKGIDPGRICVVVNTANAAEAFRERLSVMLEGGQFDVARLRITTIQLLAVELLSCKEARLALARNPRVLNAYERAFVLQDLAVCGFTDAQRESALTSLARFWSTGIIPELPADGEDDTRDEIATAVWAYLETYLIAHQAVLPEDLSYLCTLFIKHDLWQAAAPGFDHVMVDDFQNLSKASQIVCEALAKNSLVITGNTEVPGMNRDAFPCPEGLTRFVEEHDAAISIALERTSGSEATKTSTYTSGRDALSDSPTRQILNIKWKTPEEEAKGISQWIRRLTSGSKEASLSDFYLIVPNSHWARAFEQSLTSQFREHVTLLCGQFLSERLCEPSCSPTLTAFTKLNLLAHPSDPLAWRCWCGLGLADRGAESWKQLLELAKRENLTVSEAVAQLSKTASSDEETGSPHFEALRERYLEGMDFIERNQKKIGYALLKAVAGEAPDRAFSLLVDLFEGTEDARTTFDRAWKCALDPHIGSRLDAVRILSYGELTGLSPQTVILVGLNDVLMPPGDRSDNSTAELERELFGKDYQALFQDAVGKASKTLVVSTIQKMEQKTAEALGIRIARLKTEHGKTMAMLSPSSLLPETGSPIPGSESGEYFLTTL
jgi:DNA helicase-2/ATP-dependent DNA helicase PcrA